MTEAAQGAAEILLGLFKAVKDAVKAYLPFSWSILQCQVSFINVTAETRFKDPSSSSPTRKLTQCHCLLQGDHQTGTWGSPSCVHHRNCQPITIPSVCDRERGSHDSCVPSKTGHNCRRRDDSDTKDSTLQGLYGFGVRVGCEGTNVGYLSK